MWLNRESHSSICIAINKKCVKDYCTSVIFIVTEARSVIHISFSYITVHTAAFSCIDLLFIFYGLLKSHSD